MIKKIKMLGMAVLVCVTLAGCHGAKESKSFEIPEEFDTTRNHEITFWAKNDTNKNQTLIYEKAIRDFESVYPNIKVNLRLYTDYAKIYNDVITNIATNTTPNVCITYPDHIATYLTGNDQVVPLDDLLVDKKYGLGGSEVRFDAPTKDEIVPQFLKECSFAGHYYALPYMRSTEACFINKDYVEKLGYTVPEKLTWDFIWEVSEKAMAKDASGNYKINGQKVMIPFIYKSTDNMMIQMLKQKNADYSTANGEILLFNDTTKGLLLDLSKQAELGTFNTFKQIGYPANFLNAGQCIFAIDSTAGSTWMGTHAPLLDISPDKLVEFETVVRTIPQFDVDNPKMISQGPSICVFNKEDAQEVMASWLFTQYMLTNEVQLSYSETEGYVPVTTKAQQSTEYEQYLSMSGKDNQEHYYVKIEAVKMFLENIDHTFVTPVFNGSASLRDASGQLIENVTKSVRRKQKVDETFVESLYDDTIALYRLNQIAGQNSMGEGKADLGELPGTAVALISTLIFAWVMIGLYVAIQFVKERKNRKNI